MFFLLSLFFFFFLVWEERIHAGGDFGAEYWRDRIIYQAQQEEKKKTKQKKTEESPGSEPRRAQFVRNTKSVGVKQRGHGAEGRRAEGASWFGFLVQPCLGSCIPALWNHQK